MHYYVKGKEGSIEVDDRITVALNVLVWICDGQQKDMQDALSNKLESSVSIYFINCCVNLHTSL